ncbi:DUF11 domain-containing protein [Nocardioides dokdonensis]|uniref:DUF11 domain-containing protein n=1 Tax=Nocardioides dokdonensis TaxID=450734 RepID=UPI0008316154|nr:DUF11 domain-containing protein [Nocardioides dokdonensis]
MLGTAVSLVLGAAGLALLPAGPAAATSTTVPAFSCVDNAVYSVDGDKPWAIRKITSTTGASSSNGAFSLDDKDSRANALALPKGGGDHIWAFDRDDNEVLRYTRTGTTKRFALTKNSNATSVVAGAINPVTGIYYYAASGGSWTVYAFDTTTEKAIGQVATISGSGLGGNGDFAFDSTGTLWVVSNSGGTGAGTLARVDQGVPATSGATALSLTTLTATPGDAGQYHSMAFDSSGNLVIGTSLGYVARVNPASGAMVGSAAQVSKDFVDLASCALPSTGQARVDLPQGRYAGTDQFRVELSGGGLGGPVTGTTAGTDSGLQAETAEVAGPAVLVPGQTHTITQSGVGSTALGDYTTTWRCTDAAGTQVAAGTGSTGTFTMPGAAGAALTCTFTNLPIKPAVRLDKTASSIADLDGNGPDAGDTITFALKVTNTGSAALDPVTVHDPLLSGATPNVVCPGGALAPAASRTCSSRTYTLTQADVDAGTVENTATVTGRAANGRTVTHSASTSTPVGAAPAIHLTKRATLVDLAPVGANAGDTITYEFSVRNTGNTTLSAITLTDPLLGGLVTCAATALPPAAATTCTTTSYVVRQADVNAGTVDNTATVAGTSPKGATVQDRSSTSTPLDAEPRVMLDKTAGPVVDLDANGPDAGDTITYSFEVTNTGGVTLDPVTVADPTLGAVTCPAGALLPGRSVRCADRSYVLTQADVDRGSVANRATATGTAPGGTKVADDDDTRTSVVGTPGLTLVKSGGPVVDADGNGPDAGDTITYSFEVTNTGTVTLDPVTVHDPQLGGPAPSVTCPGGALAPGATRTCTDATYVLTQADVDRGKVVNTAVATGTPPSGPKVTDDDTVTTPVVARPAIRLDKTASSIDDPDGNGPDAGDTVTFTLEVTNTGPVALDPVTVHDPLFGGAAPNVTCPTGPLAAGASRTCTVLTYPITQADVDTGRIDNTATATGTAGATTVTDDDSTTTPIVPVVAQDTDLVLTKEVDRAAPRAGQDVTYTLTVRNSGPGDAADVVLTDVLPSGVTFGSATSPCTQSAGTVTCAWESVAAGAKRAVSITATVKALPAGGGDHQHQLDVQKVEAHLDLEPGQQRTLAVTCPTGYLATDGSGRIDHVDQGTGTVASVGVLRSAATGLGTWEVQALNEATGRAQAKVFAVCVQTPTVSEAGHRHPLEVGPVLTGAVDLSSGAGSTTLQCDPGSRPVQPGWSLDARAATVTSYPVGTTGWRFGFAPGAATAADVSIRCLGEQVGAAGGHTHPLALGEVAETVTVPPGAVREVTLSCSGDAKGVVAGWDLDPGLVGLGNDPRPVVRVFRLHNPTTTPLEADLWLLCLSTRTRGGDTPAQVTNRASVRTTTAETSTSNNTAEATFTVEPGAPGASLASPTVLVSGSRVAAQVVCSSGADGCQGTARLVALRTQVVGGTQVRRGATLATSRYAVSADSAGRVVLKASKVGRKALRSTKLRKARLLLGGEARTVRLRR